MSRIRNRLRFQSPEERILNGLLIVLLIALGVVGVSKWRDGLAVGATEVRGIQVARTSPRPPSTSSTTSTTIAPPTTTTTVDPALEFWFTLAANRAGRRTAPTTPTQPADVQVTPPAAAPPATAPPTTTRPQPPTTTTTRPRPTTTTTSSTTTTVTRPSGATPPVS